MNIPFVTTFVLLVLCMHCGSAALGEETHPDSPPLDPHQIQMLWKKRTRLLQGLVPFEQIALDDPELVTLRKDLVQLQEMIAEKRKSLLGRQPGYDALQDELAVVEKRLGIRPGDAPRFATASGIDVLVPPESMAFPPPALAAPDSTGVPTTTTGDKANDF